MKRFIVDALAAARVTRLVTTDDFPPVAAVREMVIEKVGPKSSIADLITCNWCAGWWISASVIAVSRLVPKRWEPIADALATSMAIGLVVGWSQREGDLAGVAKALRGEPEDEPVGVNFGMYSTLHVPSELPADLWRRVVAAYRLSDEDPVRVPMPGPGGGEFTVPRAFVASGMEQVTEGFAEGIATADAAIDFGVFDADWKARNRATMEQEQR